MRSNMFGILALGLLAGTAACGVKSSATDVRPSSSRAPTCENAITIFDGRGDVSSDYYEVAWVEAEGNSVWTTDNQLRDAMKKRAAQAGANGLIANTVQQDKAGVKVLGEAIGTKSATARTSGLAIWMPAESDRTRLACGPR